MSSLAYTPQGHNYYQFPVIECNHPIIRMPQEKIPPGTAAEIRHQHKTCISVCYLKQNLKRLQNRTEFHLSSQMEINHKKFSSTWYRDLFLCEYSTSGMIVKNVYTFQHLGGPNQRPPPLSGISPPYHTAVMHSKNFKGEKNYSSRSWFEFF